MWYKFCKEGAHQKCVITLRLHTSYLAGDATHQEVGIDIKFDQGENQ